MCVCGGGGEGKGRDTNKQQLVHLNYTSCLDIETSLFSPQDMLELMLNTENSDTHSKKLTDSEIVAQSVVFILAGYETTSSTLSLTCYHLASFPEVQDKLQEEIDKVWTEEEQMPSYDTVRDLPYLDMVISETLRLYPPGERQCFAALY